MTDRPEFAEFPDRDEDEEAEAGGALVDDAAPPKKRRRRRRKPPSPAHEARIARYRQLVEERGWIFAPPSPPRPVSWLFSELTVTQIDSLSA